jgi:hypothetical protein
LEDLWWSQRVVEFYAGSEATRNGDGRITTGNCWYAVDRKNSGKGKLELEPALVLGYRAEHLKFEADRANCVDAGARCYHPNKGAGQMNSVVFGELLETSG